MMKVMLMSNAERQTQKNLEKLQGQLKSSLEQLNNFFEALADSIDNMSDEEILEEAAALGEDPDEIAPLVRGLLLAAVDAHKQKYLSDKEK